MSEGQVLDKPIVVVKENPGRAEGDPKVFTVEVKVGKETMEMRLINHSNVLQDKATVNSTSVRGNQTANGFEYTLVF